MNTTELTGSLAFGTIGIVLLVAVVLLAAFLRKRRNRHPMEGKRHRSSGEIEDDAERRRREL